MTRARVGMALAAIVLGGLALTIVGHMATVASPPVGEALVLCGRECMLVGGGAGFGLWLTDQDGDGGAP